MDSKMYKIPSFPVSRLVRAHRYLPDFLQPPPSVSETMSKALKFMGTGEPYDVLLWQRPSIPRGYVLIEGAKNLTNHFTPTEDVEKPSLEVAILNRVFAEFPDTSECTLSDLESLAHHLEPANWYSRGRPFIAATHLTAYQELPNHLRVEKKAREYFASLYGCADGSIDSARGLLLSTHDLRDEIISLVLRGFIGIKSALQFTTLSESELRDLVTLANGVPVFRVEDIPKHYGKGTLEYSEFKEALKVRRKLAESRWAERSDRSVIKAANRRSKQRRQTLLSPGDHGRKVWKAAHALRTANGQIRELITDPDDETKLHPFAAQIAPRILDALFELDRLLEFIATELEDGAIVERCVDHIDGRCTNCDFEGWHSARSHRRVIDEKCNAMRKSKSRNLFREEASRNIESASPLNLQRLLDNNQRN